MKIENSTINVYCAIDILNMIHEKDNIPAFLIDSNIVWATCSIHNTSTNLQTSYNGIRYLKHTS